MLQLSANFVLLQVFRKFLLFPGGNLTFGRNNSCPQGTRIYGDILTPDNRGAFDYGHAICTNPGGIGGQNPDSNPGLVVFGQHHIGYTADIRS